MDDLFTRAHLASAAALVAGHEALIRDLAEKMGRDPDEVWAQAQAPKTELTCPVCGQPAAFSIGCRGCGGGAFAELTDDEIGAARRHILDLPVGGRQAKQYAAERAFLPGGCMVCPDCIEQVLAYAGTCPLLWIISPQTLTNRLAIAQANGLDIGDEWDRATYLWAEALAGGEARGWRESLFGQAIPRALRQRSINR